MSPEPMKESTTDSVPGILCALDYTFELITGIEDKIYFPTPATEESVSDPSTKLSLVMKKLEIINGRLSDIKKELNKIG